MNKHVMMLAGCAAFALASGSASAADLFVSVGGDWAMTNSTGVMAGSKYNNLQTAVDAAKANDTVWVQDGFVCETGKSSSQITGSSGYARIKLPNLMFTLRSESGEVNEGLGRGASIRGGFESGKAVRPLWSQNKGVVIQGIILENGETAGSTATCCSGGAMYGSAVISNCVVRNCNSVLHGGAFYSSSIKAYNTTIANCRAGQKASGCGGAVYGGSSFYNCTIISNVAASLGGAVYFENLSASSFNPRYENCRFIGNKAAASGCADFSKDGKRVVFSGCTIQGNEATGGNVGGVNGMATLEHCTISDNVASGSVGGVGATSAEADASAWPDLVGCLVSGNRADGDGGALLCGSATSCAFVGNVSANGSVIAGPTGGRLPFYNCTVSGNASQGGACASGVAFHNSIIWDNACQGDELLACTADSSCVKGVSGAGNIDADPLLTDDYRLSAKSPCVDAAVQETWMTTAGDPRAFDAAGYPRIRGALPDMGGYERMSPGAMVIGR